MKNLIKEKLKNILGDFDINEFSEYSEDIISLCDNWPVILEPGYEDDEESPFEFVGTENFNGNFIENKDGKEFLDVLMCGGDWQPCHRFKIIINEKENNDRFPLTCTNIEYYESFNGPKIKYKYPENYEQTRDELLCFYS